VVDYEGGQGRQVNPPARSGFAAACP
jgi:hypothetical protein